MPSISNSLPSPWTPLLHEDDQQAQAIQASLAEINAELQSALEWHTDDKNPAPFQSKAQLGEGAAGIAVYFAYMESTGLFPGAREFSSRYLNIAVEALSSQPMGPSLYSGFTGVAWAVQHVAGVLHEPVEDLSEIDLAIQTYVSNTPWKQDYDLIVGLVGLAVYCLERLDSPAARHALELIVERLHEIAELTPDEARWFTHPDLLIGSQREHYPEGYYNLGLAHGVPGIIAVLAKIYAAGIAREKAGDLLERAVRWFLQQRRPFGSKSCFSTFHMPQSASEDCRLAWCYGDAGIAATLFQAARCTGSNAWESAALDIMHHSVGRDVQSSGVRDICFCHGSAGLAHIFNRFYQATRDLAFAERSRYWISESLKFRQPGTGAAGYSVYTSDKTGELSWRGRFGLIEGIAGVGLTYLSAIKPVVPDWDRIFLVDLPPAPATKE
ncbi:MAG: hypothetical protein DMG65_05655 [Candidatus Angelobacter sp. Gp1-AA117]|nr:MAG: hypothetical protein DMG65_05655 [Candidatus Angelobacter sp. Gp1-AA117]